MEETMEELRGDQKPKIGMEFEEEQLAYNFYNTYAGKVGFSIRVDYRNLDKKVKDRKVVKNSRYVCYKAGHKGHDKRDYKCKYPKAEVRVGCLARLCVRLDRELGKYTIYEFNDAHNHELAPSGTKHMLKSQRYVPDAQAEQIDNAADSGISLGASFELLGRQVGRRDALPFLKIDQKNYLRTKRQKELGNGEHGRVLKYLQDKALENPSFFYAFQLDSENQITNIFWADAQMRIDYSLFGDVLSFDTTYKINSAHRPCAAFVGFNHHRMSTVFGVALMYDETAESYSWVFEIFLTAMNNKPPKTIFTDQDPAMASAIVECMPDTFHGLCIWHLSQNALKNVPKGVGKVDGQGVHSILSHFYYDVETEEDFEELWDMMLDEFNLRENNWVKKTYDCRKKWAFVSIRDQWTARIRSTQLSESFNAKLKNYLKSDYDLPQFFHHFDRVLIDMRYKELEAEFSLSQTCPRVKGPVRMLRASSTTYTKTIFEEFQEEYFRSLECILEDQCVVDNDGCIEFTVEYEKEERKVKKDIDGRLSCSCKLFERQGLMCCHAIKVLKDVLNTLELPEQYILKRWTRKARALGITDTFAAHIKPDCKIDRTSRLRDLFSTYNLILTSECPESYEVAVENAYELSIKVEKIIADKVAGNERDECINLDNDNEVGCKGNDNLVMDCAGVKGLKRKTDPYPKRKKRFKGAFEKVRQKAKIRSVKKRNQKLINDSHPQTSIIRQHISPQVRMIDEQPVIQAMSDVGFKYTELLQSNGVIDFDNFGLQNMDSQASSMVFPENHHLS